MPLTFKPVDLFGGAIVAEIPEGWQDVSQIRQVPDTQEVFLDSAGFSSLVFDILERVQQPPSSPSDIEALKFHLSDIVSSDSGQTILHYITTHSPTTTTEEEEEGGGGPPPTRLPPSANVKILHLLATAPAGEKMRGRPNEPDFVAIVLLLVRLESVATDLVVSVNLPHMPGTYVEGEVEPGVEGKRGELIEMGLEVRDRVLRTLEIRDWGLFGEEE